MTVELDFFRRLVRWSDGRRAARRVSRAEAEGLAREVVSRLDQGLVSRRALASILALTEDGSRSHARVRDALVRALEAGTLLLEEVAPRAVQPPVREERTPSTTGGAPPANTHEPLSHYLCRLIDEHDAPIAGVEATLETPAGLREVVTGADGIIRVDDLPGGFGHAHFSSSSIRAALAGRERGPRRTQAWPDDDVVHLRSLGTAGQPVLLPDADLQTVMVVTRTDVSFLGRRPAPLGLRSPDMGPCCLTDEADRVRLALHADAQSHVTQLDHPPPPELDIPPPPIAPPPVDSVFIAGRAMKRGGELLHVDWPGVRRLATDSRDYVVGKSGFKLPKI